MKGFCGTTVRRYVSWCECIFLVVLTRVCMPHFDLPYSAIENGQSSRFMQVKTSMAGSRYIVL